MSTGRLSAIVLGVVVVAAAAVMRADGATSGPTAPCAKGSVRAVVGGKRVCLRAGQQCTRRLDRQYHRYGFHCHSGRLTGGPKTQAPLPSAGKVVATIPVPVSGGMAVGAGSLWVASTTAHTVTRIDPATNRVEATIEVTGDPGDPFCGPFAVGFGHGSLWVLDTTASCGCVHRIDPATNRIVATIPLGTPVLFRAAPLGIVVERDGVWAAVRWGTEESLDGSVVRVDPATNRVAAVIGAGSDPTAGGPTGITAGFGAVWAGVPSLKSVVRIDPGADSVAATIPGLSTAEGQLAADASGIWVADGQAVHRIDPSSNTIAKTIAVPGATGAGARGIAAGLGSIWVQAGPLLRIEPESGKIVGSTPLDEALVWGEYSVVTGFGSVWVRQVGSVVRIDPA
jgi:streptogramin lyase